MDDIKLIELARETVISEARAIESLVPQMDESLKNITALMMDCRGRILVAGAGTSRAVAQRYAHLLACCGTAALAINAADALHGGAGAICADDIVWIISKGGQSREINTFVDIARHRGARIIAQTENTDSELAKKSDVIYHIRTTGEVDPYGMIATGSSLVNSAACDVICGLLLRLRGYTKAQFGSTHPEGAVGKRLETEEEI